MREIKFRAWLKEKNKLVYPEWIAFFKDFDTDLIAFDGTASIKISLSSTASFKSSVTFTSSGSNILGNLVLFCLVFAARSDFMHKCARMYRRFATKTRCFALN